MKRTLWLAVGVAMAVVLACAGVVRWRSAERARLLENARELLSADLGAAAELEQLQAADALSLLEQADELGTRDPESAQLHSWAQLLLAVQQRDFLRAHALRKAARLRFGAHSHITLLGAATDRGRERPLEAARVLDGLIKAEPFFLRARVLRANLALDAGDGALAGQHLEPALSAHQSSPPLLNRMALAQELQGSPRRATRFLERAISLEPSWVDAWVNLGRMRHALGELSAAHKAFAQAVELAPTSADAIMGRGLTCAAMVDDIAPVPLPTGAPPVLPGAPPPAAGESLRPCPASAASDFRRAAELAPGNPSPKLALGDWFRERGNLEQAVATYRGALQADDVDATGWLKLGNALVRRGDVSEAEQAFRQALTRAPALAAAHNGLGASLAAQGRLDEASSSLREAAQLDPADPNPLFILASVLRRAGDAAGARAVALQARERAAGTSA